MTLYYALHGAGRWADSRASNLIDGKRPHRNVGRRVNDAVGTLDHELLPIVAPALDRGSPSRRREKFET